MLSSTTISSDRWRFDSASPGSSRTTTCTTSKATGPRLQGLLSLLAEQAMCPSVHEMDSPARGAIHSNIGIARRIRLVIDPLLYVERCVRALIEFPRHSVTLLRVRPLLHDLDQQSALLSFCSERQTAVSLTILNEGACTTFCRQRDVDSGWTLPCPPCELRCRLEPLWMA